MLMTLNEKVLNRRELYWVISIIIATPEIYLISGNTLVVLM